MRPQLELRLILEPPDGRSRDVLLAANPDAAGQDVLRELVAHLHLPPSQDKQTFAAYCHRTGALVNSSVRIQTLGLRHGDRLILRPETDLDPSVVGHAVVGTLDVVGPSQRTSVELRQGKVRIGRDPSRCRISIDDDAISGEHIELDVTSMQTTVTDLGSRNGTSLAGERLSPRTPRVWANDAVLHIGRTALRLERAPDLGRSNRDESGVVSFNRPPRRTPAPPGRAFKLEAPPEEPSRSRVPFIASVIPLLVAVPLYFLSGQNPAVLLFAVLSPVSAAFQYFDERRSGRRDFGRRSLEFRNRVTQVEQAAAQERQAETAFRRVSAPDVSDVSRMARSHSSALWLRRPGDPDFADLRLGLGDQPAVTAVEMAPGGSATLRAEADQKVKADPLHDVPIVVPIARLGSVGLCGPRPRVDALARWLVAQAAVLQSHSDLLITAAVRASVLDDWSWLKWLPHAYVTPSSSGLNHLQVGLAPENLMRALVELTRNRTRRGVDGGTDDDGPLVLAVVDGDLAVDRTQTRLILTNAARARVGVIWLARDKSDVPGECAGIIELDARSQTLTWIETTGSVTEHVVADEASFGQATEIALALAPMRDASARLAGAQIPRQVTLLELLDVRQLTPDWVVARWREDHLDRAAPVGAAAGTEYVIDLNRDGPHALVAGTTRSGKSELLRAWIASLAVTHAPNRLNFLLIDYKGGAAFREFYALPHTVGYVTDLEGNLAARALTSLRAETLRRQLILREAGAKNLADMVRTHPASAPANLVIVVDELARLVDEIPEFVPGLVDVASAGGSLGLHLVLATQLPTTSIVTPNIRANTNLRIALRFIDDTESENVIGAPNAARIAEELKGRAYARTGQSPLVEFQAAYVGGPTSDANTTVEVSALPLGPVSPRASGKSASETDLQRIVTATRQAMDQMGLPPPPKPWLPPLTTTLPLDTMDVPASIDRSAVAIIGLRDEPKNQRQAPHTFSLKEGGNLLLYGSGGSGKTNALRTLAVSLASFASPADLNIYGIDFGASGLRPLVALPQCGSIIAGEDVERVMRLIGLLKDSIDERRTRLADAGAFTIEDYAARGKHDMPRILVLLDDFDSFESAYNKVQQGVLVETLLRLVSDGRPFGVNFAIAAERRGSTPSALFAAVPQRIVLRLASDDEYATFGLRVKDFGSPQDLPAGRGVTEAGLEVQIAIVGADPSAPGQAAAIEALGRELSSRSGAARAPAVEILASSVRLSTLPTAADPKRPVIGIRDSDLKPFGVDLNGRHLVVFGAYRTGRSTTLRSLASSMRRGEAGEIHLLAPRRSPLLADDLWSTVSATVETCDEKIREIAGLVRRGANGAANKPPILLVIDDAEELLETEAASDFQMLLKHGAEAGVVVAAALESHSASHAFSPWLNELRKQEHGIILNADPDTDGDLLHVVLPRLARTRIPGRGYYVYRGAAELVQIATVP